MKDPPKATLLQDKRKWLFKMKKVTCHSAASLQESSVSDQTAVQLLMQEEFLTTSVPATSTEKGEIHQ